MAKLDHNLLPLKKYSLKLLTSKPPKLLLSTNLFEQGLFLSFVHTEQKIVKLNNIFKRFYLII